MLFHQKLSLPEHRLFASSQPRAVTEPGTLIQWEELTNLTGRSRAEPVAS